MLWKAAPYIAIGFLIDMYLCRGIGIETTNGFIVVNLYLPRLSYELVFWAVMWVAIAALLDVSPKIEQVLTLIILRPLEIAAFTFVATIGLGGLTMMYASDSRLISMYLLAAFVGAVSGAIALIVSVTGLCRKRPAPAT